MYRITKQNLTQIIDYLLKEGNNIISFSKESDDFKSINSSQELIIDSHLRPSKLSLKEIVFPKSEPLFYYKKTKTDIELKDVPFNSNKTIVIGAKPCDTRAFLSLTKVFNWDYKDEFFNSKLDNTIILGLKCNYNDEYCFCEEVGLTQSSKSGSDIFLTPFENDFLIEVITEKGESFLSPFLKYVTNFENVDSSDENKKELDLDKIRTWISENFDDQLWYDISQECLGCGKCAFICPTCHCFDIVDENYTYFDGRRMKNWDTCQFGKFTLHASGHNPRESQAKRYRQRVAHKFKYYYERFGELLCTGCGRCSRECPVSINIFEVLKKISTK